MDTLPSYFEGVNSNVLGFAKSFIDEYFSAHYASTYFETRNQLLGDHFSTKFSVLLSAGLVDIKYLYN